MTIDDIKEIKTKYLRDTITNKDFKRVTFLQSTIRAYQDNIKKAKEEISKNEKLLKKAQKEYEKLKLSTTQKETIRLLNNIR